MPMTKEERELGGIEFPADADLRYSALDREDYLNWAFQSLRNPTMAALLWDYDPELVTLIGYPVSATNERAPNPSWRPAKTMARSAKAPRTKMRGSSSRGSTARCTWTTRSSGSVARRSSDS